VPRRTTTEVAGAPEQGPSEAAQGRMIALVVAAAGIGWIGVQWLGGQMGWPPKYILLVDLTAAAAFLWAMVAALRIWRRRQK
jgi:Family of unknown function (DUF5337)